MWVSLTDEQRLVILKAYGIEYDRLVREKERYEITSVSRTQAWKLEREENFHHVSLSERNPVDGYSATFSGGYRPDELFEYFRICSLYSSYCRYCSGNSCYTRNSL